MKYLLLLVSALAFSLQVCAQAKDVNVFLKKFEIYANTHYPKTKWNMPIAKIPSGNSKMVVAPGILESYMEDPKTGLRHYPQLNKIYDPETGFYIEYDPEVRYRVDIRAGKIFKGESEIQVENKRN